MHGTQGPEPRSAHSRPIQVRDETRDRTPERPRGRTRRIAVGVTAALAAAAMIGTGAVTWAHRAPAAAAQMVIAAPVHRSRPHTVQAHSTRTAPRATRALHGAAAAPVVHASTRAPLRSGSGAGRAVDCGVKKCIALTFDDGPGPYTRTLLRELATSKVHATFFLIGQNVAHYPGQVRAEVTGGHVVGNHSWTHPQLTSLSSAAIAREVDRTQAAIRRAAGFTPTLMRPPYGAVSPHVLTVLGHRHLAAVLWDVDTEDWKNRSVRITTQRALEGAHPGAIILMHDIHPTTVQAAPGIIHALRARGYTLVTVPQLLGHVTPGHKYFSR